MFNSRHILILMVAIFLIAAGCSGGNGNPINPDFQPDYDNTGYPPFIVTDVYEDGTASGTGAIGMFSVSIDPVSMTADLSPLRESYYHDPVSVFRGC